MTLDEITKTGINPALKLLPQKMDTPEARVMLLAIGLQESRFTARRQLVGNPPQPMGPAAGFWQFERGGGVRGVLSHASTKPFAEYLCKERGVPVDNHAVWSALQTDDVLAAGFARLLLFSDPKSLPAIGDENAAWDLYARVWRPGKPHRSTWGKLYAEAVAYVKGGK